jgi:adenine deaminase
MMNYRGVVGGDQAELAKLALARHVDGHAPGLLGKELQAYAAAGIRSDHEVCTLEEGRERLRSGMWVLIRQASAARNLRALISLVHEFGPDRLALCTDDREPEEVVADGHMNAIVRDAVALGVAPEEALVTATHSPARWHRLDHLGAIAPGYQADLLLMSDLEQFGPDLVLKAGRPVTAIPSIPVPEWTRRTVRIAPLGPNDFEIPWSGGSARVIGLVPGQIVTDSLRATPTVVDGLATADPARDLVRLAVIERHLATGRVGLGFVHGFGLKRGAFASSVAHDAHNIVVAGIDDSDMARAVHRLAELGGGLVVVEDGGIRAELALPVAGLLSEAPAAAVAQQSRNCLRALTELGCTIEAPFQTLSFLTCP